MRILSIGNSFSQDAHTWLSGIAAADGVELTCVNLMIGGCSLARHAGNLLSEEKPYGYEVNGKKQGQVSLMEGIARGPWDVVTLQQYSLHSGMPETYQPYVDILYDYVRRQVPDARVFIHETWAYEHGDGAYTREEPVYADQQDMYTRLHAAYTQAAQRYGVGLIPVGTAVQRARETLPAFDHRAGGRSLNRDGHHLSHYYGRYLAAAVWYATLTGRPVTGNPYLPAIDGVTPDRELIDQLQQVADAVCKGK